MRVALFRRSRPDPSHIEVVHEGERYSIALRRRANARRITLRVSSATGEILLTLPERAELAAARAFADAHGGWIRARLARLPGRVALEPGALIPLRDVPHLIVHEPGSPGPTRVAADSGGGPTIVVRGGSPGRLVRSFLEREARADLTAAVRAYAERLGVAPTRLTLRDTTSRWGSCSARGALNFSWRLVLAPPFVLDYLAAHEVAHLREMNHSPRYWRVLRELCPATDEAEAWLKHHGTGLHRYG